MRNDLMRKFDFKLMYKVTISNDIMNKILYIILMYNNIFSQTPGTLVESKEGVFEHA